MEKEFFMIASDNGPSNIRHLTEWEAQKEAERLAEENPGQKFWILRAVKMIVKF